jgi:hypothetical protein
MLYSSPLTLDEAVGDCNDWLVFHAPVAIARGVVHCGPPVLLSASAMAAIAVASALRSSPSGAAGVGDTLT